MEAVSLRHSQQSGFFSSKFSPEDDPATSKSWRHPDQTTSVTQEKSWPPVSVCYLLKAAEANATAGLLDNRKLFPHTSGR